MKTIDIPLIYLFACLRDMLPKHYSFKSLAENLSNILYIFDDD